jgi:hypothetical protein
VRITVEHPRSRRSVEADADGDGHFGVRVTRLVEQDQRSSFLRATFEHPARLAQSVSIVLEDRARRAGLRGERVEVPVDIRLQPVTRRIEGVVRIPAGFPLHAVRVVLLEGVRDRALPELVDETKPRGGGRFRLGGRAGREGHVVAWASAAIGDQDLVLRPTTLRVPAWMHDARSLVLDLERGSELSGMVTHDGQLREVQLHLTCRLDVDSVPDAEPADAAPDDPQRAGRVKPGAIDAAEDEAVESLEPAAAAPSRRRQPAEVLAAPRRFVELVYVGGRFEIAALPIRVGSDGRFRTTGLRPASYDLGDGRLVIDGRTIAACPNQERTWVSARAPASGVQSRFPVHLCLLRVVAVGRPLAHTVIRIDPPRAQAISDAEGRVVFVAPAGAGRFEVALWAAGHEPHTLWVSADHWRRVELTPRRGARPK